MDIFRRSKSTPKVGLNIGSSSVRVVVVVEKAGVLEFVSFGIEPIKKDHERADLIEAVRKVMRDADITAKRVNTSISGQSVIFGNSMYLTMTDCPEIDVFTLLAVTPASRITFLIASIKSVLS